jgi:WD40 repeat protein
VEWDLGAGSASRLLQGKIVWAHLFALSPDAQTLAATGYDQSLHLWDTPTGTEIRKIPLPIQQRSMSLEAVAFSPDGRLIAGGGNFDDGSVRVWSATTGQDVAKLEGHGRSVWSLTFAPDCKMLASWGGDQKIRIHDVPTGKQIRAIEAPAVWGAALVFSPNGEVLASAPDGTAKIWKTSSGKLIRTFATPAGPHIAAEQGSVCPAFSRDSHMLATGGTDRVVRLWEIETGLERRAFPGHAGSIQALAFSLDGSKVASCSTDTTVLLWDVYARRRKPASSARSADQPDALWRDLGSEDAACAFEAMCSLRLMPAVAVSLFKDRLRPCAPPDAHKTRQLLDDLASDRFAVRQEATRALEMMAHRVETELRQAAQTHRLPEVRRRAEALLQQIDSAGSPDRVRELRAVETLQQIGTPEARHLLESLATGTPAARLTRSAKQALEYLRTSNAAEELTVPK